LFFTQNDHPTGFHVWTLPFSGDRKPIRLVATPSIHGAFSPDGRWIAYGSFESGLNEVYVRQFVEVAGGAGCQQRQPQGIRCPDGRPRFTFTSSSISNLERLARFFGVPITIFFPQLEATPKTNAFQRDC
jgi:hypothetical protein